MEQPCAVGVLVIGITECAGTDGPKRGVRDPESGNQLFDWSRIADPGPRIPEPGVSVRANGYQRAPGSGEYG